MNDGDSELVKEIQKAKANQVIFSVRQDYKQKRLERILQAKEKPEAPTFEEVDAKPGLTQIRERPLIQKDERIRQEDTKDSYI